jgi:mRNA interferase YafQ
MREIERTTQFKRDYRREAKGRHAAILDKVLTSALGCLVRDEPLSPKHRDHPLKGAWSAYRDCHLKSDLLLIYEKPDVNTVRLIRLGSHSELGF